MDAVSSSVGVAPQSALLSRSFTDAAAVARALSFSLADTAPEPPSAAAFVHGGAHLQPAVGGGAAPSSSARSSRPLGPAGGRAEKRRRPRPSKRAPTTYISTDAATFRLMVQRVTGADDERQDPEGLGLGLHLPHFGVLGPLHPPGPAAHHDAAAAYASLPPAPVPEQPLFPTLDSWNVMYGKNEVA
jgi:hypothetical protein